MRRIILLIFVLLAGKRGICGAYSGGTGTQNDPYRIQSVDDYKEIVSTSADWGKCFVLLADLDFTAAGEIASIGTTAAYFTGTFDGNCRTICGIDVDDTPDAVNHTAMFGVCGKGAAVKNLTVMNAAVDGSAPNPGQCYTAILVGENAYGSVIDNCTVNGAVNHIGINNTHYLCFGMIAAANHGIITNCTASGTMTLLSATGGNDTYAHVGGLVGYQTGGAAPSQAGYTANCYATTTIVVTSPAVICGIGGIVGDIVGSSTNVNYVTNCHFRGTIDYTNNTGGGSACIGGIAGQVGAAGFSCTLSYCSAAGIIRTINTNGSSLYLGGGVGQLYWLTSGTNMVTYCFADVDTTVDWGTFCRAGGFVGQTSRNTVLHDCYAKGSIKDLDSDPTSTIRFNYYGGFIGVANGNISNCFCAIDSFTSGAANVRAFGGTLSGTETACFWDSAACGFTTANADAAAKTTVQMQTLSTFTDAGWDFAGEAANGTADVWRMSADGVGYPQLSWEFGRRGDFACPDGVGVDDLEAMQMAWLTVEGQAGYSIACDADSNGRIDLADFKVLAGQWMGN